MVEGLGIGYEKLSHSRPDIVMTSVTPFGQDGPYSQWDYTELTLFAMTGAMHREGLPNRYPLKYGGEIAQYFAGTTAAAVTMGALAGVALTGIGDWIDISILEAMAGHPHQIGRRAPFAYSGEDDLRVEPRTSAAGRTRAIRSRNVQVQGRLRQLPAPRPEDVAQHCPDDRTA